jgi:hypothetical protein
MRTKAARTKPRQAELKAVRAADQSDTKPLRDFPQGFAMGREISGRG